MVVSLYFVVSEFTKFYCLCTPTHKSKSISFAFCPEKWRAQIQTNLSETSFVLCLTQHKNVIFALTQHKRKIYCETTNQTTSKTNYQKQSYFFSYFANATCSVLIFTKNWFIPVNTKLNSKIVRSQFFHTQTESNKSSIYQSVIYLFIPLISTVDSEQQNHYH